MLRSPSARTRETISAYLRQRRRKAGMPPGSVVFVGDEAAAEAAPAALSVIDYDGARVEERPLGSVDEAAALRETPATSWINVVGVQDVETVQALGRRFGLSALVLEDIANTNQRPKLEEHEDYLFIALKMLTYDEASQKLRTEHVSLVAGRAHVLCFQEAPGDVFDPIRQRIRGGKGRIRTAGPAYLAYALVDVIVDHYFTVLEVFSIQAEELEDRILLRPEPSLQGDLNELRSDLVHVRRSVWPARDLVSALERSESPLVDESLRPFLRDTYDHVVQVIDTAESLREMLAGLHDLYMSTLSHRMNEVMQVLTIISTIFIPLTFIAGVYGMNFAYMPELGWRYSYPIAMAAMLLIALGLTYYFRTKDWL